jgi:tetratricopeptide (TPR) repeat protein
MDSNPKMLERRLCSPGQLLAAALLSALLAAPLPVMGQQVTSEALFEQAGKALDAGDAAGAVALYQQYVERVPNSVDGRIDLGAALAALGRYDEAAAADQAALMHDPGNHAAMLNLALAWYKMGNYEKAREEFKLLHPHDSESHQALVLLADCMARMGEFRQVIELLEPVYREHPEEQDVDYLLGNALIRDRQTEKGAAVIDRIMRAGSSDLGNMLLGGAQYAAGDYKAATETLGRVLEHNPQLPGAWTVYGKSLLNQGEHEKARAALEKAIEADPNDFDACLSLGALLRYDGEFEKAAPLLRHALELRPDSAPAQFQIAAFDANQGQWSDASTRLEAIVKKWPDFVEAHLQLATVYARLHRSEDSARERRIVEQLNEKARTEGPKREPVP